MPKRSGALLSQARPAPFEARAGGPPSGRRRSIPVTPTLAVLAVVLALATALSFVRVPHGFFRVLSFPRQQILVLAVLLLAGALAFSGPGALRTLTVASALFAILVQATLIAQFLPVRRPQTVLFDGDPEGPGTVSILSANVKQSNRRYGDALDLAREADPDLALFMETDQPWVDALAPLRERYRHVVSRPLDNAYGMILFSRLPLEEVRCEDLVMEGIPSIRCAVLLPDGQRFRLYCIHPEPPIPASDSLGRDGELVTVARLVTDDPLPAVVTGDLNDVAWSSTTRLFQRLSGLLDPRIGRGLYNTFDARFPFMRWPLDHLFHDKRFALVAMRRMPAGGSDHFPMFFRLALRRLAAGSEAPDPADGDDRELASEIRHEARNLDRKPIGTDWEGPSG